MICTDSPGQVSTFLSQGQVPPPQYQSHAQFMTAPGQVNSFLSQAPQSQGRSNALMPAPGQVSTFLSQGQVPPPQYQSNAQFLTAPGQAGTFHSQGQVTPPQYHQGQFFQQQQRLPVSSGPVVLQQQQPLPVALPTASGQGAAMEIHQPRALPEVRPASPPTVQPEVRPGSPPTMQPEVRPGSPPASSRLPDILRNTPIVEVAQIATQGLAQHAQYRSYAQIASQPAAAPPAAPSNGEIAIRQAPEEKIQDDARPQLYRQRSFGHHVGNNQRETAHLNCPHPNYIRKHVCENCLTPEHALEHALVILKEDPRGINDIFSGITKYKLRDDLRCEATSKQTQFKCKFDPALVNQIKSLSFQESKNLIRTFPLERFYCRQVGYAVKPIHNPLLSGHLETGLFS